MWARGVTRASLAIWAIRVVCRAGRAAARRLAPVHRAAEAGELTPMSVPGHKQRLDLVGAVVAGDAPLYGGLDSIKHADVLRAEGSAWPRSCGAPTGAGSRSPAPPTATRPWPWPSARRARK